MGSFFVRFTVPKKNIGAIMDWLSVLDDRLLPDADPALTLVPGREGQFWLEQVLLLTKCLLNVMRAPVFRPIYIIRCDPYSSEEGRWEALCQLPDPTLVPPLIFKNICQLSLRLGKWMCDADVESTIDRNLVFAMIEREALQVFNRNLTNGKSTFQILRVAHDLAIPYRALPGGVFQLGWGANARYIDRSTTDRDSGIGMRWSRNKHLSAQILQQGGLPVPIHLCVTSVEDARRAAESLGYPVVVKPVDLERGEGVSVDVDAESLDAAFDLAREVSPTKTVLIEQQVAGVCHRLFVAGGQLLYVSKRQPLGVYGDGKSTIKELVEVEYTLQRRKPTWSRSKIQLLDEVALGMLKRQGWTPEGIPPAEQFIALRRIESTALGGSSMDVTDLIHPENVRLAVAATRLFGLEVAGIDIMTKDIAQPWHANSAVITEVNFAPLLGGRVSLKYIGEYLSRLIKDGGRIPLYAYEGGLSAKEGASRRWRELRANGIAAFLVDDMDVLDHKGEVYAMAATSLAERVDALLLNRQVGAIIIFSPSLYNQEWLENIGVIIIR